MRPIIETIKSDKVIDENFENIKNTLCGNVSLDNMAIRIIEGVTQDADLQNLVIHSGQSRPVGYFPLIGDVYVQEISDKYIDIRSTKPQVAYKILVMFGPQITNATLKEVGGPNYKTTEELATEITEAEISYIEQIEIQYKPLALQMAIYPNPCIDTNELNTNINRVIAGSESYYIMLEDHPYIYRINKTTNVVDYIDFSALVGAGNLTAMREYGTNLYVAGRYDGAPADIANVWVIDSTTFAITDTYYVYPASSRQGPVDIYINDDYVFCSYKATNSRNAYISRYNISTAAIADIGILDAGLGETTEPGNLMFVAGDATNVLAVIMDTLWVVVDNSNDTSAAICRIEIRNPHTGADMFSHTYTGTNTAAFEARAGVAVGTKLYIPVKYSVNHQSNGGLSSYATGLVTLEAHDSASPYAVTLTPLGIDWNCKMTDTILADNTDYIYLVAPHFTTGVTTVVRYEPSSGEAITFFVPIHSTGDGENNLYSFAFIESDGAIRFFRNTSDVGPDYSNFTVATVDFSDYDE